MGSQGPPSPQQPKSLLLGPPPAATLPALPTKRSPHLRRRSSNDGCIAAVKQQPDAVVLNVSAWAAPDVSLAAPPPPPSLWRRLATSWECIWQQLPSLRRQRRTTHGSLEELAPETSTLPVLGPPAARRALAVRRWQWAVRSVLASRAMTRDIDLLHDRLAPGADRLHALVDLEVRLSGCPNRKQLALALLQRREHQFTSFKGHLINELFITGERIFEFFTPPQTGHHRAFFTVLFLCLILVVFWFMAGQYPGYKALKQPASLACMQQQIANGTLTYGPEQTLRWLVPKDADWCFGGKAGAFEAEFLILWGARWGPDMRKAPQRWLTSILLHQNFMHIFSNCVLFAGLAYTMERKYGTWRLVLLYVLSALGGNLFSAVFEKPCVAVVGASGGIFGIFGLFIADMIMNFETLQRPLMRSVILLAFFIFFAVTIATTPTGTSHLSHVGGFLCGLFPSFLFLPNLHSERWEAWLPIVGSLVTAAVYITLPTYFYVVQFPSIHC